MLVPGGPGLSKTLTTGILWAGDVGVYGENRQLTADAFDAAIICHHLQGLEAATVEELGHLDNNDKAPGESARILSAYLQELYYDRVPYFDRSGTMKYIREDGGDYEIHLEASPARRLPEALPGAAAVTQPSRTGLVIGYSYNSNIDNVDKTAPVRQPPPVLCTCVCVCVCARARACVRVRLDVLQVDTCEETMLTHSITQCRRTKSLTGRSTIITKDKPPRKAINLILYPTRMRFACADPLSLAF